MLTPKDIFDFVAELLRLILLDELSERIRRVRLRCEQPPGMAQVHRHVHRPNRRRLLNHLSTGTVQKSALLPRFPSWTKFRKLLE